MPAIPPAPTMIPASEPPPTTFIPLRKPKRGEVRPDPTAPRPEPPPSAPPPSEPPTGQPFGGFRLDSATAQFRRVRGRAQAPVLVATLSAILVLAAVAWALLR